MNTSTVAAALDESRGELRVPESALVLDHEHPRDVASWVEMRYKRGMISRLWKPALCWLVLLVVVSCQDADPPLREPQTTGASQIASNSTQKVQRPSHLSGPTIPGPDDIIKIYNAEKGTWDPGVLRDVPIDGEFLWQDALLRVLGKARVYQWINDIDVAKLPAADATYNPTVAHRYPEAEDVVYVTGPPKGYHALLRQVPPGRKLTFQGRLYETKLENSYLLVRYTGITINRVTHVFQRRAPTLVDLTIRYADTGVEGTFSGTPEHPFYVPARAAYMPMGELEVGTVLETSEGSAATVIKTATRHGDFPVYNFEVEHAHNYFVSAPGSKQPGVLVHNTCSRRLGRALEAAGYKRPPGSEAHHIVAGTSRNAREARTVLQQFGIGIDDAANGVFLPARVHRRLHTSQYYRTINRRLGSARSRAEAEAVLHDIRFGLLSGGL